jgi:N utilization substance protein A
LGADSGGQSGDIQGLSRGEIADSESVTELAEEGQDYEAGVISGVENAPDADQGEVRTHEVPEDDVPEEYLEDGGKI